MKLMDFFGLDLSGPVFDVDACLAMTGLDEQVSQSKTVQKLSSTAGSRHPIVGIAKRQLLLKQLQPLLNGRLTPYDKFYYQKEVKTGSDQDRRYDAEEKMLQMALMLATGRPFISLERTGFKPDIHALRDFEGDSKHSRFDEVWKLLSQYTHDTVAQYRQENAPAKVAKPKSLFKRMFGG